MEKEDILDNVRKSLEITLTFFTVILVSILFFVVAASSESAIAVMNQNATCYQVALSRYQLQTSFWTTFFNSFGFLLLISGIIYSWLFIGISYLVNSRTIKLCLIWSAIIATAFGFFGAVITFHTNANYYPLSFILLITIAMLIWLIVSIIKVIEASKAMT